MKYKVGDLVRVKGDLRIGKTYGSCNWVYSMEEYKNKIFHISQTCESYYELKGCPDWRFSDEMLEPATGQVKPHEHKFVVDRQRGFKTIYINGVTIAVPIETPIGIAIKNPDDEYDEERGRSLAYYRMGVQE